MSQELSTEERELAAGYVLGDLTVEETTHLQQLIAQNPALLQELHALQASLELLPQALPQVEPPAHLRAAIVAPLATQPPRSPKRWLKWLVGMLGLAALALALDNLRLRQQLQLAQQVPPNRVAAILQQPNSRLIALTGKTSNAAGTLLFTPGQWQEVIVSLGNLPALPPEQIYRMWLSLENGEVLYCGEFNTDADGAVFVKFRPPKTPPKGVKAKELFVTIDDSRATPNPAGEKVMQGVI